jgi:hypothetical protein
VGKLFEESLGSDISQYTKISLLFAIPLKGLPSYLPTPLPPEKKVNYLFLI